MSKTELRLIAFKLVVLVVLVAGLFVLPAEAQTQVVCRDQCIENFVICLNFCTTQGSVFAMVCGAVCQAVQVACGAMCSISG